MNGFVRRVHAFAQSLERTTARRLEVLNALREIEHAIYCERLVMNTTRKLADIKMTYDKDPELARAVQELRAAISEPEDSEPPKEHMFLNYPAPDLTRHERHVDPETEAAICARLTELKLGRSELISSMRSELAKNSTLRYAFHHELHACGGGHHWPTIDPDRAADELA